jgi:integrase
MARAKPQRTKYPGLYKFETTKGTIYAFQVRADGKQHWERLPPGTKIEDARSRQVQVLNEIRFGDVNPFTAKPRTFEDFARNTWLPSVEARVARGELESSTAYNIRRELLTRLLPTFGSTRLDRITVESVERFQDELSLTLSNWTVRRIIVTLGSALELASRHKLIRENPCRAVRKVEAKANREVTIPTRSEVFKLANTAPVVASVDEKNLIIAASFTGARISELFGLRWQNVDLTEGQETLIVAEQVYQGERKASAKTQSGHRAILLGPEAAETLRSQQVEGRSSDLGLVFPSPQGTAWRASNFHRRRWQPIREAAGLPELHFHDLRHFYVTYVRTTLGLPPALTEQLAGHSDERTHKAYTHATPEGERIIRAAMARAYDEAAFE